MVTLLAGSQEAKMLGIHIVVWKEVDNIYTFEKRGREGEAKEEKEALARKNMHCFCVHFSFSINILSHLLLCLLSNNLVMTKSEASHLS